MESAPQRLDDRAQQNLDFIRQSMERTQVHFSAVPGKGGIAMGIVGAAAGLTSAWLDPAQPVALVWLLAAPVAALIGAVAMRHKAKREGAELHRGVGRRFLLQLLPALVVGGLLSAALLWEGEVRLITPIWLSLYGLGVLAAGSFSVAAVLALGAAFLALGSLALVLPVALHNLLLSLGFGLGHILAGAWIARHHGG